VNEFKKAKNDMKQEFENGMNEKDTQEEKK
jgi:hypothetical protein